MKGAIVKLTGFFGFCLFVACLHAGQVLFTSQPAPKLEPVAIEQIDFPVQVLRAGDTRLVMTGENTVRKTEKNGYILKRSSKRRVR
jgi:hypothetical protein